jgi:hypothetical protein
VKHELRISELRALSMEKSAFFYHDQMQERGDKMSNFRLDKRTVNIGTESGIVKCYALHRRVAARSGEKTAYLSVASLFVVEGKPVV